MADLTLARTGREEFTVAADTRPTYFSYYWSRLPALAQVAIIFFASRVVTTVFLLAFASQQQETWQSPAKPDLWTYSNLWDSAWFERIATGPYGYSSELPRNEEGQVTENAWAFMPLYPVLVRGLMLATTLPWDVASVLVATAFGFAAAWVFNRTLALVVDKSTTAFATLLFCIAPTSPLLQLGYAESAQSFFVAVLLYLLIKRQWLVMLPVIVLASFTRPTGLAWAMTLGLYFLARWWMHAKGREPFPRPEVIKVMIAGLLSAIAGFGWLLIAWAVTGEPSAYIDTELAWRIHYTGPIELEPFTGWFHGSTFWFGQPIGAVIVVLFVIVVVGAIALPIMRRLGIEIRIWLLSYFTYLFAVFFPQSSTFRLLMPMFPVLGAIAIPKSPLYRVGVVVLMLAGQLLWLYVCWYTVEGDWTPA